ncbi:WecB/TagA/CpsF family glycosyltransferase [Elongatibacter sediminis]|uniref:WecB/TagA/CpsF family glycosyltransferase n=1 Tax=Elongatibacter sediminis TaxID=3119006 RepID=A0AAW9RIM6_9GAMM
MEAAEILLDKLERGSEGTLEGYLLKALNEGGSSVFFCNVHMLMLASEDSQLAAAMSEVDLLIPDGVPVAWLMRRLGVAHASVFRGYQGMLTVCRQAESLGKPVGLFGATDAVLAALGRRLVTEVPGLRITFSHAPPFADEAGLDLDSSSISEINAQNLHALFIGLGCPKQEKWIGRHAARLNCALLGVGAAFDWLAGSEPMPPQWMERSGLVWLFRFLQNPLKMWKRYLIYNSKFLIFCLKMVVSGRRLGSFGGLRS